MPHLLDVDDLSDRDLSVILERAASMNADERHRRFTCALVFATSSLRTRVGYSVAATRLGGVAIEVADMRWDTTMSAAESFEDALRTVTGMVDVAVVRCQHLLSLEYVEKHSACPIVNGGDTAAHPTQALIDAFAIEQFVGPIEELRIGICGDLTMRASRSLLQLFARRPPRELVLIAPPSRSEHGIQLGSSLEAVTSSRPAGDLAGLDVLHLPGLAPRRGGIELGDADRLPYGLSPANLGTLSHQAVVLSPMPVIDEIHPDVRGDSRIRMFDQSDSGVAVRAAVLEWALGL